MYKKIMKDLNDVESIELFSQPYEIKNTIIQSFERLFLGHDLTKQNIIDKNQLFNQMKEDLNIGNLSYYIEEIQNIIKTTISFQHRMEEDFVNQVIIYLDKIEEDISKETLTIIKSISNEIDLQEHLFNNISGLKSDFSKVLIGDSAQSQILQRFNNIDAILAQYKNLKNKQVISLESQLESQRLQINKLRKDYHDMTIVFNEKVEELNEKSTIDVLTEVYNRRGYNDIVSEKFEMLKYDKIKSLYLVAADIDFFKEINDNYGHEAGDKALKRIAYILKRELRDSDYLCRIGGEEFVIIVENSSFDNVISLVERIRSTIENAKFKYKDNLLKITSSFGISEVKKYETTQEVLLQADNALYSAKENGRNQVHYYDKISEKIVPCISCRSIG